ncbi:MAG: glutathione S-transferase family protein [Sphingomicrobium sp.]
MVTLQLYAHPFSSYCQKVLIALWADGTPFDYHMLDDQHPENMAELHRRWPFGKFPLMIDNGETVVESTSIIEHLQAHHPGPNRWIPDGDRGRRARFLDRFFDGYVMGNMMKAGLDILRPEDKRDPYGADLARAEINLVYAWLEANLGDGPWAIGDDFTLADCAAAPSLFYADWVEEIGPARPRLAAYRARLLAHPIVARAVDEGRPYRDFFPLGAPDRD